MCGQNGKPCVVDIEILAAARPWPAPLEFRNYPLPAAALSGLSGLSPSNIQYMRKMAATWPESAISPQAVGKSPWGHVRVLLDKLDAPDASCPGHTPDRSH